MYKYAVFNLFVGNSYQKWLDFPIRYGAFLVLTYNLPSSFSRSQTSPSVCHLELPQQLGIPPSNVTFKKLVRFRFLVILSS